MVAPQLVLASKSPRRHELLSQMGVRFVPIDADIDESARPGESARDLVERLARGKAEAGRLLTEARDLPVLGSDTVVVLDEHVLTKPADSDEAAKMLRRLSGRTHTVLSAVAVTDGRAIKSGLSRSLVTFRRLSEREIAAYVATGDGLDKAGAYGVQGQAGVFVEHLEGSYSGVMGLPLALTYDLLGAFGVDCWSTQSGTAG